MKKISITDKGRIEKIYKAMKTAGLYKPQLELLEVNLENLIAEKNESIHSLGKGICSDISASLPPLQSVEVKSQESDKVQKYYPTDAESFQSQFLSAVRSGNIQYQKSLLLDCYNRINQIRRQTGCRTVSRTRFLEETRRLLEHHGLNLDKALRHFDFCNQHSN